MGQYYIIKLGIGCQEAQYDDIERRCFPMSVLQEQAVRMICDLSDDNVSFLIEIIRRLMPQAAHAAGTQPEEDGSVLAFRRLEAARKEISQYLPKDFDLEKELEEARAERYGDID
jgi:hypothetical protein